jgi:hypothetical protein
MARMSRFRQIALWTLTLALASRAGWTSAQSLRINLPLAPKPADTWDAAAMSERRFSAVKLVLPPDAVVGFLTLPEIDATANGEMWFAGAQYCLAPRLLVRDASLEYLIGNFPDDAAMSAFIKDKPLQIIARVLPGVAILRNVAAKTKVTTGAQP